MAKLTELHIVPNKYMPENTVIVGPRTYELLTGESYAEAVAAFGRVLAQKVRVEPVPDSPPAAAPDGEKGVPS